MLSFENDYSCTATPEIIERISEIAQNQYPGYGNDSICESAKAKIREACACPDAQIFFLVVARRPTRPSSTPSHRSMPA